MSKRNSSRAQNERFAQADQDRLQWILDNPVVHDHERNLFRSLAVGKGPVLEIGGGEGLTLRFLPHLAHLGFVGTDLHLDRVRAIRNSVPREAAPGCIRTAVCNAVSLPFADRSFGTVLCRDVLHHIPPAQQQAAWAEMARVTCPGGTVCVIEPNAARAPLAALFSAAIPTERWALSFNAQTLQQAAQSHFSCVQVDHLEPSMLYRLLLHYRFGMPSLGHAAWVKRGLAAWEWVASHSPSSRWSYVRLTCTSPRVHATHGTGSPCLD